MADIPMEDSVEDAAVEIMESEPSLEAITVAQPSSPFALEQGAKPMDAEYTGEHIWMIPHIKTVLGRVYSDKFEIGTYIWRLLIVPKGLQNDGFVSIYLDAPEAPFTPPKMYPMASFTISILHQTDPSRNYHKDSSHTFTAKESDWGFPQTIRLADVDHLGYLGPDDSLTVKVQVNVRRDQHYAYDSKKETGCVGLKNQGATCYMNSLLQYLYALPAFRKAVYQMPVPEDEDRSKSLPVALQSVLFKLQYGSSAVSTKDLTKSFGWGSYEAFMQHDIQELNRVLCEKLEDKMKGTKVEKVLSELFEGAFVNIMQCVNVDYCTTRRETFMDLSLDVKDCQDVYASLDKFVAEELMDGDNQWKTDDHGLQDAKKGIKFESFPPVLQLQLKRFDYDFARDTMVKINDRYEFPDELDLDQDRYYAPSADRSVKNVYKLHSVLVHSGGVHGGHYYAYVRPDGQQWLRFDDDKVVKEDASTAMQGQYGGDEDMVGANATYGPLRSKAGTGSNAYMLVYVRSADWSRIMCPVVKEDIAEHLRVRLEQEHAEKEERARMKQDAHQFATLRIATEDDLSAQIGKSVYWDLMDFNTLPKDRVLRVPKKSQLGEVKQLLADGLGMPADQIRLWTWDERANKTLRPKQIVPAAEDSKMLCDLRDYAEKINEKHKFSLLEFRLFLELPLHESKLITQTEISKKKLILLFVKLYDPIKEKMSFLQHFYMPSTGTVAELLKFLDDSLVDEDDVPADARPLEVFEEIKSEPEASFQHLSAPGAQPRARRLKEVEMEDGDVLIVQRSAESAVAAGARFPTADRFLEYIHQRRMVRFKRLEDSREEGLVLELSKNDNYDQVCQRLAHALKLAPEQWVLLRLTLHNFWNNAPQRIPVRWGTPSTLEQLLVHGQHSTDVLYYEVLDMPLKQVEQLKTLRVALYNERVEPAGDFTVRLAKDALVQQLLEQVAEARAAAAANAASSATTAAASSPTPPGASQSVSQSQPSVISSTATAPETAGLGPGSMELCAGPSKPLRLLEVTPDARRIFKVVSPSTSVSLLSDQHWQLRVEEIPEDQLELTPQDRLLHVQHWAYERERGPSSGQAAAPPPPLLVPGQAAPQNLQAAGDPLLLRVREGDTLSMVKARLQAQLGISPEEFAKWEWIGREVRGQGIVLGDNDLITPFCLNKPHADSAPDMYSVIGTYDSMLGLGALHEEKGPRRPNFTHPRYQHERAVKIYA